LNELQTTSFNDASFNLVQFLYAIASEHKFEVRYDNIKEKSNTAKCQSLVQLSTLPAAVCKGNGASREEAPASATQTALDYLKIISKKLTSKQSR
jgi:RISC-loading complex subunit TARBP2